MSPILTRFSIALPAQLLDELDRWIARKGLPNRSESIRQMIRQFISKSQWEENEGLVCGTVTLLYDHHSHDASNEITSLQHDHGPIIICTTHAHIDHDHCLEVVCLKGPVEEVKRFVDEVSHLRCIQCTYPAILALPSADGKNLKI